MDASNSKSKLIDGVTLAILPAIGFASAYNFESSYNDFFGIPHDFAQVDSKTIVVALVSVFSSVFLALYWVHVFASNIVFFRKTALRRTFGTLISYLFLSWIFILLAAPDYALWVVVATLAVGGFFGFVFPLITQRKVEGYENKLLAQEQTEREASTSSDLIDRVVKAGGRRGLILVIIGFVVYIAAGLRGSGVARTQREFLSPSDSSDLVVVRAYGERLILVGFDEESKHLDGRVVLRKFGGSGKAPEQVLEIKKVGPLLPRSTKENKAE